MVQLCDHWKYLSDILGSFWSHTEVSEKNFWHRAVAAIAAHSIVGCRFGVSQVSNAACMDNDMLSCLTFWKTLFYEIKPFKL
jgi:hypothetical protein